MMDDDWENHGSVTVREYEEAGGKPAAAAAQKYWDPSCGECGIYPVQNGC